MFTRLIFSLLFIGSLTAFAQQTTICWDTSLSMEDRNLDKDLEYLSSYFAQNSNTQVTLLQFKTGITAQETYTVSDGNWDALKTALQNTRHDGATSLAGLSAAVTGGDILLFTDGKQTSNQQSPVLNGKLTVINSNSNYELQNLQLLATLNGGTLVNLAAAGADATEQVYTGQVISKNNVVASVKVSVKGKGTTARSQADGRYSIHAEPGDILVFSAEGKNSVEKKIGNSSTIDVFMYEDGIRLGEVLITAEKERPIVIAEEKMTAYGNVKPEAIGYAVESIGDEEISEITTDLSQAVQGKLVSVNFGSGQDISQAVIRGMNSFLGNNYALIVIDGVALRQSDSSGNFGGSPSISNFLDPNTIGDITVLKGLAAANRFGSAGKNGVILITTKMALYHAEQEAKGKKPKNTALLTDNIYDGKIKTRKTSFSTAYLDVLKKDKTIADAYTTYLAQRANYRDTPEYFIDVADFFTSSNQTLATQILSNILEDENSSLTALKGLLFKAHQQKNYTLELEAANRILELYPEQIQSYLDLAMAHKHAGNYQEAMDMLNKMTIGSMNPNLDFKGLTKIVDNELKNLIGKHRAALNTATVSQKYLQQVNYDARLTFAWNNADAEFDLQFVNPQKRFFNWEHTMAANAERLLQEKRHGYTKEEFLLIGAEKGQWLVNASYKGNKDGNTDLPTFLTCTVEYNFGKPNQRTEEFLIRLHEKGSEETLAKVILR